MILTILQLLFTIIVVPIVSFYFNAPLTTLQLEVLHSTLVIVIAFATYAFVLGQITGNNSQIDKLWSILPIVYVWYMAYAGHWQARMILMAVLVTIWGLRLTYNFARRGAYTWKFWAGEEDYRWAELRKHPILGKPIVWMFFNLIFICAYQSALIFAFTLPSLAVLSTDAVPLGLSDIILSIIFIAAVAVEYIADEQQYRFQTEKYRRINAGVDLGEYRHGFVRTGLWRLMRHPNYAMEQLIWIIFYLFSVFATGQWINWSIAGCVLLLVLFKGSSDFSETITLRKYPEYADYQNSVGRFLPFKLFRRKK